MYISVGRWVGGSVLCVYNPMILIQFYVYKYLYFSSYFDIDGISGSLAAVAVVAVVEVVADSSGVAAMNIFFVLMSCSSIFI